MASFRSMIACLPLVVAGCAAGDDPASSTSSPLSREARRLPNELPVEIRPVIEGLLGHWKFTSGSTPSLCGESADADFEFFRVAEKDWTLLGDIIPTGGVAYGFALTCIGIDGAPISYLVNVWAGTPLATFGFIPAAPAEAWCYFRVDWSSNDGVLDPNLVFCTQTKFRSDRLDTTTTTLRRVVPIEPPKPGTTPPWVPESFAVDATAAPCSASLQREGDELRYLYECSGQRARYTFARK